MPGVPEIPVLGAVQEALVGFVQSLIRNGVEFVQSLIGAIPLSETNLIGFLAVIVSLLIVGEQQRRQSHVGRPSLATTLLGFGGGFLIIIDFLPSIALDGVTFFLALIGGFAVLGLWDYISGETTPNRWYKIVYQLANGHRLALVLAALFVVYVWGISDAVSFFDSWM